MELFEKGSHLSLEHKITLHFFLANCTMWFNFSNPPYQSRTCISSSRTIHCERYADRRGTRHKVSKKCIA